MKQPKGTKVYDGREKFFDRYTIIFPGFEMALGLSGNPNSPQGFSQWGQFKEGRNLGKKIRWEDLPREVRDHALRRYEGSEEK